MALDKHENSDDFNEENAIGLYPPKPGSPPEGAEAAPGAPQPYGDMLETICGMTDDSQPVEQYDGSLGVTRAFVDRHETMVGQLQWRDDLAARYTNPGDVSGVRWCTGTMISHDLFLTAGHCFDSNPFGWQVPRINGTNTPIAPEQIVREQVVNFNFQDDANGNPQTVTTFDIEELIEYRLDGLDFAIVRLRSAPGAIFGKGVLAPVDPAIGDMMAIIGHPAGVPKRIEAGPVTAFDDHRIRYNDIDTLGGNSGSAIWHAPTGRIVGVHTNGGCNPQGTGSNFGLRISRIIEASPTVRRLSEYPYPLATGTHPVRQESSGRFMDAHENAGNDFSVVTRTNQNNSTQRWHFTPIGQVCMVRQVSSGRFMDAHQNAAANFEVVSRAMQDNDTQKWVFLEAPGDLGAYTIQQLSSSRFLDAHERAANDFSAVTRTRQNNATQRWRLSQIDEGIFNLRHAVNGRFLDAHQHSGEDFSLVTRPEQNNDTQAWQITQVGAVYEIEQASSSRHLDAHEQSGNDFSAVTRAAQGNDTQRWVLTHLGGERYHIQHLVNGRFLDAHQSSGPDFSVVTRDFQNNATQNWLIG